MSPGVRGLARLVGPVGTDRESRTLPAHASPRRFPALWLSDSAESREALANEFDGPRVHSRPTGRPPTRARHRRCAPWVVELVPETAGGVYSGARDPPRGHDEAGHCRHRGSSSDAPRGRGVTDGPTGIFASAARRVESSRLLFGYAASLVLAAFIVLCSILAMFIALARPI